MSKYLIAILLSAWSISLRAQVAEKLQQLGMENIQTVTEVNGNTTIAFEDNVYRGSRTYTFTDYHKTANN